MIDAVPPGLVLLLGGAALPLVPVRLRPAWILGLPLITLWLSWSVPAGAPLHVQYLGWHLIPLRVDLLSRLFALVFSIMAFGGGLFALKQASVRELAAAYIYAGAAIGAVFAGDLMTLFVFWEIMAVASAAVIWSTGSRAAYGAGMRYLGVHLFGGVLLMVGILAYAKTTGSIAFDSLSAGGAGRWLILAGFLINAGAPPFSSWLPDAYPEASATGSVFLSAFTTKTAVYVLLRGFAGEHLLIYFGLFMVYYGIIYALLENDMRRILAYSIVNQVGFMVTAVGIGTPLALNGAAAHAFAHIIYKALLLMSAGAVLQQTGKRKCSDLGGLFRTMPVTMACGVIGALAISAFPLTSGFVTKSMINQAAADQHMLWPWLLLVAASAGVFLHAGIKFPWFVFFQKDSGLRPPEPPANMRYAMYVFAFLCVAIGVYPAPLYALLPFPVDFVPYTGGHVVSQLQLLFFAGLAFFAMLPLMARTLTVTLDVDWLYRRGGPYLYGMLRQRVERTGTVLSAAAQAAAHRTLSWLDRYHGPEGIFGRAWPTGRMVIWVALMLVAYLLFAYAGRY